MNLSAVNIAMNLFTPNVTTDSDGDAEAFTGFFPADALRLRQIHYVRPEQDGFDDGVNFEITSERTEAVLWSQEDVSSGHRRLSIDLTPPVEGMAGDRLKITISGGGNAKTATFIPVIE